MDLSNIKRPNIKKGKKRLGKGLGSGWGNTAGIGLIGQKSRSGGNIPAWFEGGQLPIQRRLPKRGFTNIFKKHYRIVNLQNLLEMDESIFDIKKLEELGVIPTSKKKDKYPVKILAKLKSEFTKKVDIKANAFSSSAKKIIEDNGGKAEVI